MTRTPFIVFFALGILAACSSTTTTTGGAAPDGGAENDAGGDSAVAPDGNVPLEDCGDATSIDQCVTCCETVQPAGAKEYYKDVKACGCKPIYNCQDVCAATICSDTPVKGDAACTKCLTTNAQAKCLGELQASCGADKGCVAFVSCFSAAGCDKKPQ